MQALSAQVLEKEQKIQSLIVEREQSEQALSAQVLEKEQKIQSMELQVSDRSQQLERMSQALNEILISKAWKFALFLRKIRVNFIPPGSWRERSLRMIYRKLNSWRN